MMQARVESKWIDAFTVPLDGTVVVDKGRLQGGLA